ncbi:unnamed protein product [Vitrella brassicaformis CCMP3155]|uniref:NADP-dependent oxidoreductase domain-containing protein n=1 Tax=Vitrella brassicaformis (strain CCMP3155) TaxID=1169540 RepID=A0A0G4FUD3_VITBC|nr:unnamed protein product [Vitrella brassicaformis CCMP3155]|eukprot:CEM18531.1 unnamed protein product [Vitrella brassicaformis CCMP3155]
MAKNGGRMLKYHKLGKWSDIQVSELCLGTMTWGEQNTEAEAHAQLDYFESVGGTFIDTAEMYPVPPRTEILGRTETYLGRWLKGKDRSKFIIASKVPGYADREWIKPKRVPPMEMDGTPVRPSPDQMQRSIATILHRLQTDYVDILYIHWPDRYKPIFGPTVYDVTKERETLPFLDQLKAINTIIDEGKAKAWAVSNESTFGLTKFCELAERHGLRKPVCIQNDYSLINRTFEYELAEACSPRYHNIAGVHYGLLAGGSLTGKYNTANKPTKSRHTLFPKFQARYHCDAALKAVDKYMALASKHGLTMTQLAMGFAKSRFFNTSPILGATSVEQLKECIDSYTDLPAEVLKEIDEIHLECRDPMMTV